MKSIFVLIAAVICQTAAADTVEFSVFSADNVRPNEKNITGSETTFRFVTVIKMDENRSQYLAWINCHPQARARQGVKPTFISSETSKSGAFLFATRAECEKFNRSLNDSYEAKQTFNFTADEKGQIIQRV